MDTLAKKMTKQDFFRFIKPLADKSLEILESNLRLDEELLMRGFLEEIIDKETKPEELLNLLTGLTPLQAQFSLSKGLAPFIEDAEKYLKSIKNST